MRDIFFYEIKKRVEEIREIEKADPAAEYHITPRGQMLIDTMEYLIKLANIARKEGLLALEEKLENPEEQMVGNKYIRQLGMLIVDGTDPKKVEEIALLRYFASNLRDYGALQFILIVFGIRGIQAGDNPVILEHELINILPEEIMDEYKRLQDKEEAREQSLSREERESRLDMSAVHRICSEDGGAFLSPGDDHYYIIKLVEHLFNTIDDHGIQRVLRDIENNDLAMAMKVLSGEARSHIFANMSVRLSFIVAEDMDFMGPIRLKDAGEACKKIFKVFIKFIEAGEIVCSEDELIRGMSTIFLTENDRETDREAELALNELNDLWNDYLSHTNRIIG